MLKRKLKLKRADNKASEQLLLGTKPDADKTISTNPIR